MNTLDGDQSPHAGLFAGVKWPSVAGVFYPSDPSHLRAEVEHSVQHGRWACRAPIPTKAPGAFPRVLIAPHAGYQYSGSVAGAAFGAWAALSQRICALGDEEVTVFVLGPNHRVPLRGFALPKAGVMRTPLGDVKIDSDVCSELVDQADVVVGDSYFDREHCLEVELPFLQTLFGEKLQIVPILVGSTPPESVCRMLEHYFSGTRQGRKTLFVFSSDLSHFLDDARAKTRDAQTIERILRADRPDLKPEDACGYSGLNGLVLFSQQAKLCSRLLDAKNSSDCGATRDRVVGYAALGFWEEQETVTRGMEPT